MTDSSPSVDPLAPTTVPVLNGVTGIALAMGMTPTHALRTGSGEAGQVIQLPPQARGIFPLIDGRNSVADLATRLDSRGVNATQFAEVWRATVEALGPTGLLSFGASPVERT